MCIPVTVSAVMSPHICGFWNIPLCMHERPGEAGLEGETLELSRRTAEGGDLGGLWEVAWTGNKGREKRVPSGQRPGEGQAHMRRAA